MKSNKTSAAKANLSPKEKRLLKARLCASLTPTDPVTLAYLSLSQERREALQPFSGFTTPSSAYRFRNQFRPAPQPTFTPPFLP